MLISIKCSKKGALKCPNRFPALTVVVKFPTLGKVGFGEYNIRHHFKMRVQMIPHIIQVGLVGDQIGLFLCPLTSQKFCCVFSRHGDTAHRNNHNHHYHRQQDSQQALSKDPHGLSLLFNFLCLTRLHD